MAMKTTLEYIDSINNKDVKDDYVKVQLEALAVIGD
ncbi:hypothetical protein CCACVL1_17844 [Corchorus capsularis]|uniref:Uncharacterized protein n=1 Tax=Corchorus capsularis TaxID=210143 RepID=A0A1R3HPP3_COCAP|nr:hypothetical protein CCACVL1_17844 [Corchorus capsularis]